MKVLHVYNLHRFRGGADRATLATIDLLRAGGLEVESFACDSRELGAGLGGKLSAFVNGIYGGEALSALAVALKRFRPQVVHAHKLYPLITPWALRLCKAHGVPVAMSVYDYMITCPVGTHMSNGLACLRCAQRGAHWAVLRNCRGRILESAAYAARHAVARRFGLYREHVDRFITPTAFSGNWLIEHAGIAPERIVGIPFAFELPDQPANPAHGTYFAFVGRFAPEKGIATLLAAASKTGHPLRLLGDRPALPMHDVPGNVEVVVAQDRAQVLAFYRGARALVVPSEWFETLPLVIGEAMSAGVPVIASRIGGLPDFIADGKTGLLFEPGDSADLARCLERLWQDPALAAQLGSAARTYIRDHCAGEVVFDRLREVYEQLERKAT